MDDMGVRVICRDDLAMRVDIMNQQEVYRHMSYQYPVSLQRTIHWFATRDIGERVDYVAELVHNKEICGFG